VVKAKELALRLYALSLVKGDGGNIHESECVLSFCWPR